MLEPPASVVAHAVGHRVVLAVAGEIDMDTADQLHAAVDEALDGGARELWIDLTETTFMDSSGIHVLLETRTRLRALERRLAVICPPGDVRHVLEVAGLDGALPLYDDRSASNHDA